MTTYTLTLKHTDDNCELNGDQDTFTGLTMEEVKRIAKRNCSSIATWKREKAVKVVDAPKFWYYRGEMVVIHEERQNGWTLVSNADGSRPFYFAVTRELEYR